MPHRNRARTRHRHPHAVANRVCAGASVGRTESVNRPQNNPVFEQIKISTICFFPRWRRKARMVGTADRSSHRPFPATDARFPCSLQKRGRIDGFLNPRKTSGTQHCLQPGVETSPKPHPSHTLMCLHAACGSTRLKQRQAQTPPVPARPLNITL